MHFSLCLQIGAYTYRFEVVLTEADNNFEQFRISAGNKVVLLQSNRPMLRRRGLKRKPITWKVIAGEIKDQKALEKVCKAIEQTLEQSINTIISNLIPQLPARAAMRKPNDRKQSGGPPTKLSDRT